MPKLHPTEPHAPKPPTMTERVLLGFDDDYESTAGRALEVVLHPNNTVVFSIRWFEGNMGRYEDVRLSAADVEALIERLIKRPMHAKQEG